MCHHGPTRRTGRLLSPLAPSVFDCRPIVGRSVMLINLGAFSWRRGAGVGIRTQRKCIPSIPFDTHAQPSSVRGDAATGPQSSSVREGSIDLSRGRQSRLRSGRLGFSFATRPPEVCPLCIRWHDSKVRSEAASTSLQPPARQVPRGRLHASSHLSPHRYRMRTCAGRPRPQGWQGA